jgi:hypothetical protein
LVLYVFLRAAFRDLGTDANAKSQGQSGLLVHLDPAPTATADEINKWLRSQPPASLANLLPKEETPDPFDDRQYEPDFLLPLFLTRIFIHSEKF